MKCLRFAGDDAGIDRTLQRPRLKIITNFYSSRIGIADTRTSWATIPGRALQYDKVTASATNSRDKLPCPISESAGLLSGKASRTGRKSLDSLLELARRQKDPYAQFEIAFGRAQLSADRAAELDQLRTIEVSEQKPVVGMSEPDRNISLASVLREEARIASASGQTDVAQEAISKLERSAAITRDLIVENNYESARGYALFAQGDFANSADELASDPHSPLALQQLAIAQEKLGNASAAESTPHAPEIPARPHSRVVPDNSRTSISHSRSAITTHDRGVPIPGRGGACPARRQPKHNSHSEHLPIFSDLLQSRPDSL